MYKAVLATSFASDSSPYAISQNGSQSLRLSRMWLESIQTGPVRTSLDDYRPKALESVVSKLQQSGVPGPMMLFGDPEYLGQGSQFIVYKQRMAITEYHGFSTRDIAAKQPKYDINPDIRLSLSDETVRKHLNDIYLELYALTIPTLGTHPNIVRLFGWSFDPSSFHAPPLLIMELAGSNILTLLSDRSSNISDNTKYNLCCNIGAGLDALHDHGIVHGDLKPENVLIFPSKGRLTAKLADFGLSINEGEGPRKPQILGGTRGWMAPEVEASTALEPEAMFKADNYSCGLLTWSIAIYCGQPPPSSNARSLHMIAEGELQRARETSHHHMYSILASAVKNLLQPDCLDRPSRVSPLLGDTEEACDAAIDDAISETTETTSSAEVPSPFSTGRYFSWELPALCTRFLDGLHSRLVDSPSSIAPEVLFIMFLAFSLYSLDDADEAQRAREALIAAAVLGYTPAQAVARRVYAFYEYSPPHEVEDRFAEWEVEAASTGSPLAQIDLQQQNDDNYIESKRFFQARGGYNAYYSSINFEWASNGVSSESDGYSYIHWLATYGSLPQMQEHLNMTANSDINSITVEGETPLYLASARGHYHIVAELLNRGADVAVHCTQFNISPVHWLFAFDVNVQSKVIGLLVDGGADLDARTAKPLPFFHFPFLLPAGTPLHWAVMTSNHTAIQALLHYGADVQIRDGSDPYMWDERVRVLNKFGGPNQEAYSFSEGETQGLSPLDHAAAQHDPFIFETLLATQRKEDMNAVDEEGFSVFHRLSTGHVLHTRMGNGFTVRPFLGRPLKMQKRLKDTVSGIKALGGNVDLLTIPIVSNAQSSQRPWSEPSYTPLMLASIDGAVNIVRALLENGANVELENDKQETAVFCLFDKVQYSEDDLKLQCLELLVSSGADINHRSKFGETPVLRAAKGRLIDSVDFCLSLGASIDERDMNPNSSHPGRPLLHFLAMEDAAFQDSEDIAVLRLLEKHVFDKPVAEQRQTINATDDQGETVLHRLCGHGMLNSVQELLAHGASVNALATSYTREHEGDEVYEVFWQMTPLDHAIRSRDLRRKRMERDRGYLNSEFQNLAERSESIIKALKDAGGVQAPEDRGRKHLVFDRSRYPEGPGAIVEARGER